MQLAKASGKIELGEMQPMRESAVYFLVDIREADQRALKTLLCCLRISTYSLAITCIMINPEFLWPDRRAPSGMKLPRLCLSGHQHQWYYQCSPLSRGVEGSSMKPSLLRRRRLGEILRESPASIIVTAPAIHWCRITPSVTQVS